MVTFTLCLPPFIAGILIAYLTKGISMQEAARRAVREFLQRAEHQDRVAGAAGKVMSTHAEALRRLGE